MEDYRTIDGRSTAEVEEKHSRFIALAAFADSEEKALAVGDAACEDFYDNDGKFDPEKLRALLAFFQSLDFSFLLEGHCAPEDREEMLVYLKEQLTTKGM